MGEIHEEFYHGLSNNKEQEGKRQSIGRGNYQEANQWRASREEQEQRGREEAYPSVNLKRRYQTTTKRLRAYSAG